MKKLERIVPEQIEELRKRIGNRVVMVGADIVRQLFCEIDHLRMELKPLAKTANGVPVYVGMAVWTRCTWEAEAAVEWTILQIRNGCVQVRHSHGSVQTRLLSELYSTREAVEEGGEG